MSPPRLLAATLVLLSASFLRAEPIPITILHLNDVYEITRPVPRDLGGLTRVAGLQHQLRLQMIRQGGDFRNVLTVLAGDFFSPSALGTAVVDGQRLDGRQMVAVLNALRLDIATFGNHEFDIPEGPFHERLKEARFRMFSGNYTDAHGKPFPGVAPYLVRTFRWPPPKPPLAPRLGQARVGFLGLTIAVGVGGKGPYWRYHDYLATAKRQVKELREKEKVDLVVAVTHLSIDEDIRLAREVPGIDLILGGHEHENNTWRSEVPGQPPIFKADANVRTVWVHQLRFDPESRKLDMQSQLRTMTNLIEEDPQTAKVTDEWIERGFAALKETTGRDPREVVVITTDDLEGRESYVRRGRTNLTRLIAQGMKAAVPDAYLAVYNSGMIRIDDVIPAGPLTWYDILRILPYGGNVMSARIKGSMLQRLFDAGFAPAMVGDGGYLQVTDIARKAIDPEQFYLVAIDDYLLAGREVKLSFLGERKGEVIDVTKVGDLREAVVAQLRRQYPAPETPAEAVGTPAEKTWGSRYSYQLPWLVAGFLGLVLLVQMLRARRERVRKA
jgi:5'-nucleotidase